VSLLLLFGAGQRNRVWIVKPPVAKWQAGAPKQ